MRLNNQKIPVYNICAVNVVFRIRGELYNEQLVLLDRDSFCLVGHITNDFIHAEYEDGKYDFLYYRERLDPNNLNLSLSITEYRMIIPINIKNVDDLKEKRFRTIDGIEIEVEFKRVVYKKEIIKRIYENNKDVVELKI